MILRGMQSSFVPAVYNYTRFEPRTIWQERGPCCLQPEIDVPVWKSRFIQPSPLRTSSRTFFGNDSRLLQTQKLRPASFHEMSCHASSQLPKKEIPMSAIIGGGRIGLALSEMDPAHSFLIGRGETVPAGHKGPIYVCTRNDDLDDILKITPLECRENLVFLQNGMLQPWLEERHLEKNTQALIYFAVPAKGAKPEDGGLTAVWGKWADEFARRLGKAGIKCDVIGDKFTFDRIMIEKLLWISVFLLLSGRYNQPVGVIATQHRQLVEDLVEELQKVAEESLGVTLAPGVVGRLCDYSMSVSAWMGGVKEYQWRNGWFVKQKATPLHAMILKEVGVQV